ncbi:hypothetical protein V1477_008676 [Vespula maculifrons]|uniref:Uncharacterized protein n=1 Tax=Vespula maculifrons TaxID=7453 RepID=A0ABD2CDQ7_VESMC
MLLIKESTRIPIIIAIMRVAINGVIIGGFINISLFRYSHNRVSEMVAV